MLVSRFRRRLSENELLCDCHLRWLARWLMSRPALALFTLCTQPYELRGKEVVELSNDDFVCPLGMLLLLSPTLLFN